MADLNAAQIKAILTLKLQRAGLRPSAADIKAKEIVTLQGDSLVAVSPHAGCCSPCLSRPLLTPTPHHRPRSPPRAT
jgi:hypothetical protein